MTRDEILATANACVSHDRAATYGDAVRNFTVISDLWSAYLGHTVTPGDVGGLMALMKIARAKANPSHADSLVDACGYLSLSGEMSINGDR